MGNVVFLILKKKSNKTAEMRELINKLTQKSWVDKHLKQYMYYVLYQDKLKGEKTHQC